MKQNIAEYEIHFGDAIVWQGKGQGTGLPEKVLNVMLFQVLGAEGQIWFASQEAMAWTDDTMHVELQMAIEQLLQKHVQPARVQLNLMHLARE